MAVQITSLSNGFRVVTEHMPGFESVALGVWVTAGGRHENNDQTGLSHLLEHMAFKGTSKRSALQIAEEIENVGGFLNAYTGRETTAYHARVLTENTPLALDIIADILRDPSFDHDELALERNVILQEIGQSLDTPDDVVFDWMQETAYPDQPIGRPILGEAERVSTFTAQDLIKYRDQHYTPERMILSAAGGVDHDAIVKFAEDFFGDMERKETPTIEPAKYHGGEYRREKDLEQAHVLIGTKAPGYKDPDYYKAQLYATALGGGMSSRLFQEVREKQGLCYAIYAFMNAYSDSGMLTIYAGASGEQLSALSNTIADQINQMPETLSEDESNRARAQLKAGLLMGLETPSARCDRNASMVGIHNKVVAIPTLIERLDAVTHQDLCDFGATIAASDAPTMALYGPIKNAPDLNAFKKRLSA